MQHKVVFNVKQLLVNFYRQYRLFSQLYLHQITDKN